MSAISTPEGTPDPLDTMSPKTDEPSADVPPTPSSQSSRSASPIPTPTDSVLDPEATQQKKKKKKKSKKPKSKETNIPPVLSKPEAEDQRPPVLCISRNKHWRYISSYHVRFACLLS